MREERKEECEGLFMCMQLRVCYDWPRQQLRKRRLRGRRVDGSESGPQSTLMSRGSNRPFDLLAALDLRGGDAVGDGHVFHGGRRPRTKIDTMPGPTWLPMVAPMLMLYHGDALVLFG